MRASASSMNPNSTAVQETVKKMRVMVFTIAPPAGRVDSLVLPRFLPALAAWLDQVASIVVASDSDEREDDYSDQHEHHATGKSQAGFPATTPRL